MNEFLYSLVSYGALFGVVSVAIVFIILSMGAAVSWTKYLVFGYLVAIMLIPETSSFGTLSGENTNIFWVKGSKTFFFPFSDMFLFGTWLFGVVLLSGWKKETIDHRKQGLKLGTWYLAYGLLFMGYVILAIFGKDSLLMQFQVRGVINILWQGMVVALFLTTIRSEKDVKTLILIMIICLTGREIWGLFRYFFLGGDPQNIYANFDPNNIRNVKITFFDINDHIFACLILGFSTWKLLVERLGSAENIMYSLLAFMAILIPSLSARRTALGGVLISIIFLYFIVPKAKRLPIAIIFAIALPLAFTSLSLRTDDKSKTLTEKILMDVKVGDMHNDPRKTRFYELQLAWDTVKEEPFFGVGPSGSFKVDSPVGVEYHNGKYDFVHSGPVHVLLKTGLVGLAIFIGIFLVFVINVKQGWRLILPEHKALVVGALCGFVAQFPSLLFEGHVIEKRSMLVSGVLFAIPLICIAVARQKKIIVSERAFLK